MPDRDVSTPGTGLPSYVTMPLLERVQRGALDEEYAERARRLEHAGGGGGGPRRRVGVTAVALVLAGMLAATAFVQNARISREDETSRAALLTQIGVQREELARLQRVASDLQSEVSRLERQERELADREERWEQRQEQLSLMSGFIPVIGEGVRVTVDDSTSSNVLEDVRDEDLALLVDALWGAGAEAIAINGKRLTVLSSIRNTGIAINVNSRPLSPPYVVEAIGDQGTLQSNLLASARGNTWIGIADQLNFRWSMQNVDVMRLPASRPRPPMYAVAGLGERVDKEVSP